MSVRQGLSNLTGAPTSNGKHTLVQIEGVPQSAVPTNLIGNGWAVETVVKTDAQKHFSPKTPLKHIENKPSKTARKPSRKGPRFGEV